MTENSNKPALILILPPDGKFHSPDIWSILHRQAGGFDFAIVNRSRGAAKIIPAMAKAAAITINGDEEPLGAQLNRLVRDMGNPYIAFFTDRALPTHDHWLRRLCEPLEKGNADATFGRHISAPGGNYFIIEDLRKRYPQKGDSSAPTIDNCAFRRSSLLARPFQEKCNDPAAVWLMQGGTATYAPEALAMRDTLLPLKEVRANAFAEGEDFALGGKAVGLGSTITGWGADVASDIGYCFSKKKPQYLWYPFFYRAAARWGRYKGGKSAR